MGGMGNGDSTPIFQCILQRSDTVHQRFQTALVLRTADADKGGLSQHAGLGELFDIRMGCAEEVDGAQAALQRTEAACAL